MFGSVGIPEKTEGKNPITFIESLLTTTFVKDSFSFMFAVERAHRVPARPHKPGEPLRPFLFKLLNFKDRDAVLYQARPNGNLMKIDSMRISVYPDFSAKVQCRRTKFTEVKKGFRSFDVTYAILYPARLCIAANDESHFFDNPATASNWLERVEHKLKKAFASTD